MENSYQTDNTLTRWFGLCMLSAAIPFFWLGRCTAPQPAPVMFTKVNIVEVEKEVIKYLPTVGERECLAQALFAEARGESYEAAKAMGSVIMNRVADKRYPDSICGVVRYLNKGTFHFSYQYTSDANFYKTARVFADMRVTEIERSARERAYKIADNLMAGVSTLPSDSLNYHATSVEPDWAAKLTVHKKIGGTIFYTGF